MSGALLKHTERLICLNVPFVDAMVLGQHSRVVGRRKHQDGGCGTFVACFPLVSRGIHELH
jgi:hypothetical protein